jgi:phenylacetate-CoA ligase
LATKTSTQLPDDASFESTRIDGALMAQLRSDGTTLHGVLEVRTVAESISDELRVDVAEQLNAKLFDVYSSEELGYMAIQCPVQNQYHVQSESLLLEVLREDGSSCALNEPGRIVVTSLLNYATPLIRYEIGDYGELAGPCSYGRDLPVLKTINGRVRNMLRHPMVVPAGRTLASENSC